MHMYVCGLRESTKIKLCTLNSGKSIVKDITAMDVILCRSKLDVVVIDSVQCLRPYPTTLAASKVLMEGLKAFAVRHFVHIILIGHTMSPDECDGLLSLSDTGLRLVNDNQVDTLNQMKHDVLRM